jgi:hypothetical protein
MMRLFRSRVGFRPLLQWAPRDDEGWIPYLSQLPPRDAMVEFHSIWQTRSYFAKAQTFPLEMNVSGLYWRYP